jgi:flagellar biogenesis protein FliO
MFHQVLAVFLVLGLLGAVLWLLRSRGLARFTGPGRRKSRHLEAIARLPLTPQHSVHLIRVSDHAILLALSPTGCTVVESLPWNQAAELEIAQPRMGAAQ